NKIWNVTRFILMSSELGVLSLACRQAGSEFKNLELADRWILSRYQCLVRDVTELFDGYDFGEAARKIYDFLWGEFCDWYVEISKKDLYSDDPKRKERVLNVLLCVLEGTLRIMHPLMPFISEEIWALVKGKGASDYLLQAEWPKVDNKLVDEKSEKAMEVLKAIITSVRNIKAEMGIQTQDIEVIMVIKGIKDREIVAQGEQFIKALAKISKITIHEKLKTKPEQSATGVVGDIQFYVPLKGLVDIEKEVERLKKEQEKTDGEIERLKALLAKKSFVDKADPEAVQKQRDKLQELTEKKMVLTARLQDLAA
ncbi:MAG: class I tRNA ligase family protein, partial [bacterium]